MIGITAAAIIPAKAPLPDITPNAAPRESAAKLTVNPARKSLIKVFLKVFMGCDFKMNDVLFRDTF
jgi:hypothetical protein